MFDNLLLIAIGISAIWLVSYGLYLYSSSQHQELQHDVESLERELDGS